MDIFGREREIGRLRQLIEATPALVIISGRRRVGKTYLLQYALSGYAPIFFQAEDRPLALQLDAFARECSALLPGRPKLSFDQWSNAFDFVGELASSRRSLVVIMDEFQYLADADPGLVSTIQRYWDRWDAGGAPIMLVLAGSALAFMESLLEPTSPTYGRATYRPRLLPLSFRDAAAFANPAASSIDLIERYAVFGGVPQYQRWAGPRETMVAVREMCLEPGAPLHAEPEHLIRLEGGIREPGPYFGIMEAISQGRSRPSMIAAWLGVREVMAGRHLARLEDLGYVRRVEPLEPGHRAAARSHWTIADPFLRFWFRFVSPNRGRLAHGREGEVAAEIERDLPAYVGPVFEECCRKWVAAASPSGADAKDVGSWWSRRSDVEIDVAAIAAGRYTLLGTCKWTSRSTGLDVLEELRRGQAATGGTALRAKLAVFSRAPFQADLITAAAEEGVLLISVDDLFGEPRV